MTTINLEQNQVLERPKAKFNSSEKLEKLQFEKRLLQLYCNVLKIELKVGKKASINYLNGYLEEHNLTLENFSNTIKNI